MKSNGVLKGITRITGKVKWTLHGPDGKIKQEGENHNLVVTEGDNFIADQLATTPAISQMGFMVLGTGYSAAAKGNVWVTTGYSGNSYALDATYPKIKGSGTDAKIVQYQCTFEAAEATANGIDEVIISNVTAEADGSHPAASTILAYAQITPEVNKGAADTLVVLWEVTLLGA